MYNETTETIAALSKESYKELNQHYSSGFASGSMERVSAKRSADDFEADNVEDENENNKDNTNNPDKNEEESKKPKK
jgi:hypothetical protein